MISILWFILILSVLIISHEFGHFILARVNGIKVIEFSMGMGPTIFSFTKSGTKFSLKLLPIGGACVMEGEDGIASDSEAKGISFREADLLSRISVVIAGPMFNFILAFLFSMIIVSYTGIDLPVIQGLTEGFPAAESGLQEGDLMLSVNGEAIHLWRELILDSRLNDGETVTIEYLRDGEKGVATFKPEFVAEENRYRFGIEGGTAYEDCKGFALFKGSYYELRFNFLNTLKGLKSMILGKVSRDSIAGPVGVAQVVDETYDEVKEYGVAAIVLTMMNIAMILSVNLGVINLLPLPALDGGRLVFLLVELVRGKPVPPEKEGLVHFVGIILFFALTIFVLFNDISRWLGV